MTRVFILFDGRAAGGVGTEDALPLDVCQNERDAQSSAPTFGQAACYSYEVQGDQLTDEQFEWDYFPPARKRKRKRKK